MKKYIIAIILFIINYAIIKAMLYCWNLIPIMPIDKHATLMTYCTFALFILEMIVFHLSISRLMNFRENKPK